MLAQLMNLPAKFLLSECIDIQEKYRLLMQSPEALANDQKMRQLKQEHYKEKANATVSCV